MSIYADSTSVSVSKSEEHEHREPDACQDILHIRLLGCGFDSVYRSSVFLPAKEVLDATEHYSRNRSAAAERTMSVFLRGISLLTLTVTSPSWISRTDLALASLNLALD